MAYPTKALMVLGIGAVAQNYALSSIAWWSLIYAFFCFILGRVWFGLKLVNAEHEVQNKVNPFVEEMRNRKI